MAQLETALKEAMEITGAIGVALVDHGSGMMLGSSGGGDDIDLELAAAGSTEVVRAQITTTSTLGLDEPIEDILVSLETQCHLVRLLRSSAGEGLFLFLVLDRQRGNLAMARRQLEIIESELAL